MQKVGNLVPHTGLLFPSFHTSPLPWHPTLYPAPPRPEVEPWRGLGLPHQLPDLRGNRVAWDTEDKDHSKGEWPGYESRELVDTQSITSLTLPGRPPPQITRTENTAWPRASPGSIQHLLDSETFPSGLENMSLPFNGFSFLLYKMRCWHGAFP